MKNRLFLLISLFALTSCGTKVNKLGSFGMDHSGVWADNYYSYYDSSLKSLTTSNVSLKKEENKVFISYDDDNFIFLEERATGDNALSYYADYDLEKGYGPNMKLSNVNNYVREGVVSKLFDGQLFCHGYYEAARVQINQNGFSSSLGKKLVSSDYLYLNFKSALDFKSHEVEGHVVDITINITFYSKDNGITYSYSLTNVPTNQGETYIFYGFSTKGLDLNNADRFAISYTLDKESYNEEKGVNYAHALLLYEFGFKNPIFEY